MNMSNRKFAIAAILSLYTCLVLDSSPEGEEELAALVKHLDPGSTGKRAGWMGRARSTLLDQVPRLVAIDPIEEYPSIDAYVLSGERLFGREIDLSEGA